MRQKLIIIFASILMVVVSCRDNKKNEVSEKIVGLWSGIDSIVVVVTDSLGFALVERVALPIEVEVFKDSTFYGRVHYNDSTIIELGALLLIEDSSILSMGSIKIDGVQMDLDGDLYYRENPESLTLYSLAKNPYIDRFYKGKAIMRRKEL